MFEAGIVLVIIGAVIVYGTAPISKALKITTTKGILILKASGLIIAILGAALLFFNDRPEKLQFLRIIRF
ncbi:hypothetical protein SAMN05446037_1003206 [Anaerovirgula multivorans]|uniref:Uncharacterized protein n=1 Tax=Anaerovirgula multivorans TaxID=312168 RepID=A0A239BF77_9FIRM|nr:hypothetical protein [Anaerovirgula multivorans]SNS06171.1 hypothetical protein SAMN05446037_1003206 [Anaerovirgula multivorans]